jgi:putative ABC transport system permease protein
VHNAGVQLSRDIRHTLRALVRSPGFTSVTVLLMALGIGTTTSLFSLTYGVLLKPLVWPESDRLLRLQETRGGRPGRVPWTISNTTYHAWNEEPATIEEIGGWTRGQLMTMTVGSGNAERLTVGRVTPSLLRVLRAQPALGRLFGDADAAHGREGPDVVVLGFGLWQRRFGGDPGVIGRSLRLDDRLLTIVGVLPKDFSFPDHETQAWLPLPIARVTAGADVIQAMIFNAIARLRPGVTAQQAAGEATSRARAAPSLGSASVALFGSSSDIAVAAVPARDALTADVRPALIVLLAAVALIFSTAIASVVALQATRVVRRRREMAVRMAIGAGAGQIARQWLIESTIIGIAGGFAGLLAAAVFHQTLRAVLPPDFPRVDEVRVDAQVALFAGVLTFLTILVCGLLPVLQSRDRNLVESLAGDASASAPAATVRSTGVRGAMMVAQVAIACVLLVGTALLARSFAALLAADRGFDPRDVLTAHITTRPRPFASMSAALERAQQRLQALGGVAHVGFGNALPFVTSGGFRGFTIPSPRDPGIKIQVQTVIRTVSPEYFPAMGLRVVAGRALADADTSASRPVVVVNRTFATQYLGADPIGIVLPIVIDTQREWEVVGVVDDVRQGGLSRVAPAAFGGVADPPQPELFFTYRQWTNNVSEVVYVVRGGVNPAVLGPALRAILREEDSSLAIESVMTMEDRVMHSLARPRTYAVLLGGFAGFAVLIAAVGLFGVMSYMAAQRTREIGIRTALGARPRDILRLVTTEAVMISFAGLFIGLIAAFLLAKSLAPLLYGVSVHDTTSFVAVPIVLIVVVAIAGAIPARRATRLNPLVALRHQ